MIGVIFVGNFEFVCVILFLGMILSREKGEKNNVFKKFLVNDWYLNICEICYLYIYIKFIILGLLFLKSIRMFKFLNMVVIFIRIFMYY